jgi:hypothetical protein
MENKKNHKADQEKDFYLENGLMVFTRSYHLKRGYCCNHGCRHCPYKIKKEDKGFRGPELR